MQLPAEDINEPQNLKRHSQHEEVALYFSHEGAAYGRCPQEQPSTSSPYCAAWLSAQPALLCSLSLSVSQLKIGIKVLLVSKVHLRFSLFFSAMNKKVKILSARNC